MCAELKASGVGGWKKFISAVLASTGTVAHQKYRPAQLQSDSKSFISSELLDDEISTSSPILDSISAYLKESKCSKTGLKKWRLERFTCFSEFWCCKQ